MKPDVVRAIPRRNFLKFAGAAAVGGLSQTGQAAAAERVCLVIDPENSIALSGPSMRAAAQLGEALGAKGVRHEIIRSTEALEGARLCIILANSDARLAEGFPRRQRLAIAE